MKKTTVVLVSRARMLSAAGLGLSPSASLNLDRIPRYSTARSASFSTENTRAIFRPNLMLPTVVAVLLLWTLVANADPGRSATGSTQWVELVQHVHATGAPIDRPVYPLHLMALAPALESDYVVVLEDDGTLQQDGFAGAQAQDSIESVLAAFYALHPDTFDFVTIFTTWSDQSASAYYLPIANDVRGIGVQRVAPFIGCHLRGGLAKVCGRAASG